MKSVTIYCKEDGHIKIEADGFTDNSCALATKQITDNLLGNDCEREDKPEMSIEREHESETEQQFE